MRGDVHHIAIESPAAPSDVQALLAAEVRRVLAGINGSRSARLVQVVVPVEVDDPLGWLGAQETPEKFYWSGRDDADVVAAVGAAEVLAASAPALLGTLQAQLSPRLLQAPAVRYYGGVRFDLQEAADKDWAPFGAYRFVLPRFELRATSLKPPVLICNLVVPQDRERPQRVLSEIDALVFPALYLQERLATPLSRDDEPGPAGWRRNIEWALEAFQTTGLDKVVLARKATFTFPDAIDPLRLLHDLEDATPRCFHFYVQPEADLAFVGASPERLFKRTGRTIVSEAVAGTRPRGTSAVDDERLRDELLLSEKDQREHAYVQRCIAETLGPLCEHLEVDAETSAMTLARGRHLYSGFRGTLRAAVTDLQVLEALHPTPAVGGYPTGAALEAIRTLEAFDRGWYAGPVGWVGADGAEFAVGIRSGLVRAQQLSLFSGAGIVPGSTPAGEWEEIEHKIGDFINVLGLDLRRTKY